MKFDVKKFLPVVVTGLGFGVTLLSNLVEKNNRNEMKEDIKKEILKELSKDK